MKSLFQRLIIERKAVSIKLVEGNQVEIDNAIISLPRKISKEELAAWCIFQNEKMKGQFPYCVIV